MTRSLAIVLVLGAILVAVPAAQSRSGRGVAGQATSAGCNAVGWIAKVTRRAPHAYLRRTGASKSCKTAARLARNQKLYANETIFSGGGTITFKSVGKGVPNLTCIVSSNSKNIIYPALRDAPGERSVLNVVSGATSCQAEAGKYQKGKKNAVFVVDGTRLTVDAIVDPVFGIKTGPERSLIQVKKGVVSVAPSGGQGSETVGRDQQIVVSGDGTSTSGATVKLDPTLKPALCALTPELRLTEVKDAAGARAGSDPLGVAPDSDGNIWFTDVGVPAIGFLNPTSGKITYPQNGGLRPDSAPRFIVADTEGKIWFTDVGATPAIGMIDPKTRKIVEYPLEPGSKPWNPAYDPVHKLVWFTDLRTPTGAIGAFDPKTKKVTKYSSGLRFGSQPEGIVVDRKGNVWFTDDNDPSPAIGMLDGRTHEIVEFSSGLVPGSLPRGMTIGADRNGVEQVWFADERAVDPRDENSPHDGLIGMIRTRDPQHRIVEYAVEANGGNSLSNPQGLTWYRGYVWFTDDGVTKAIGRIDPTTGAITESSEALRPDSKPIAVVVTKGVLWFTDRLEDSPRIGRLQAKPSC